MATCRIHERYSWIKCQHPILPSDPEGFCILHSQAWEKDQAAFNVALKDKLAKADYDFRGVFFPAAVSFYKHEFKGGADFSWATFSGGADFFGATFSESAGFSWATFSGGANFFGATFSERAFFFGATFSVEADFSGARFSGEADFSWARFSGRADFNGATFSGRVIFRDLNKPRPGDTPPANFEGTFIHLELAKEAVLRFQDLSLAQVEFAGTDLRHVDFRHVAWHPYRGRQAIYDEIPLRAKEKERPGTGFSGPDIAPYLAAAPPAANSYPGG